MLIAAALIGLLTAYYFGLRPGVAAALASAGLFLAGIVIPSKLLWTYGIVGAYTAGILVVGPRMPGREQKKADLLRLSRRGGSQVLRAYRRLRRR